MALKSGIWCVILGIIFSCTTIGPETSWKNFIVDSNYLKTEDFVSILKDKRLFSVMAFINAIGYNDEIPNMKMTAARIFCRAEVEKNLQNQTTSLERWKKLYGDFRLTLPDIYSYALSLNTDYPFKQVLPFEKKSEFSSSNEFDDFTRELNLFWSEANMESVWVAIQPFYRDEVEKYDIKRMSDEVNGVWDFLREPRQDSFQFLVIPNLVERHYLSLESVIGNYFICIESAESNPSHSLNTHEYLHTYINQIIKEEVKAHSDKIDKYYRKRANARFGSVYNDIQSFASECLVRAIVYYISGERDFDIENHEFAEFTLLKPFIDSIDKYHENNLPFRLYLPKLFEEIPDLKT